MVETQKIAFHPGNLFIDSMNFDDYIRYTTSTQNDALRTWRSEDGKIDNNIVSKGYRSLRDAEEMVKNRQVFPGLLAQLV